MGVWAWVQPVGRIWKVVSDRKNGKICVYNEKNDLILEQEGLSKEAISLIERNFLGIVATSLSEEKPGALQGIANKKQIPEYDYMYA